MTSSRQFDGGVFCEQITGGRAAASIQATETGVRARADEREFVITYPDCRLEQGGASGTMLFCRNPDRSVTIFCEDSQLLDAMARAGGSAIAGQVEQLRAAAGRARAARRRLLLGALLALLVLGLSGYYGLRAAARHAVASLPTSVDEQIGQLAREGLVDEAARVEDPVVVDAIETIVTRLEPHAEAQAGVDFDFDVLVVRDDQINAFALPGGTIVVYTGLIEQSDDAVEVAGVLGHEMAHVTRRHGIARIGQSLGLLAAVELLLGDVSGLLGLAVEVLEVAALTSYGRGQEAESDADAVRTLHAAGLPPTQLARFFERLAAEQGELPAVLAWQSSHPLHAERVAAIERQAAELSPVEPRPLPIDWGQVQARIADATP